MYIEASPETRFFFFFPVLIDIAHFWFPVSCIRSLEAITLSQQLSTCAPWQAPWCAARIFKTCIPEYLVRDTDLFSLRLSNFLKNGSTQHNRSRVNELILYLQGGTPKNPECIYKKLHIYSYMFKLQSPSKYSPFDTTIKTLFPLLKTVFELVNFDAF